MTAVALVLGVVAALLLFLLFSTYRRRATGPPREETKPRNRPSKLDGRLRELLTFTLDDLRELKRRESEAYRKEIDALKLLHTALASAEGEKRRELVEQIADRTAGLPVLLTFGLYFPEHDLKDVSRVTSLRGPFVSTIVWSDASAQDLAQMGIHVRTQAGDIFTAYIPVALARELTDSPLVNYIELARPWLPQLDAAMTHTQLDTLHSAVPAITGSGVIVGVIDVGPLDVYHPAFRRTDNNTGQGGLGSSRVRYIWDQTLSPNAGLGESGPPTQSSAPPLVDFAPTGGTYGTEYDRTDIDKELTSFPPAYTTIRSNPAGFYHGTLVTSCAAGKSRGGNYPYAGAAPDADIIYVQTANGNNYVAADSSNFLDGFAYIFARASQLGQPCVANLSGGDSLAAHDGTALVEQFIDNLLLLPGRVVICASGNHNKLGRHTRASVAQDGTTTIKFEVKNVPPPQWDDTIQIWYAGSDQFEVTVTAPTSAPNVVGPVAAGTSVSITLPNGIKVTVESILDHPANHDNLIEIRIRGATQTNHIPYGVWVVAIGGTQVINGVFEAWIDRNNGFALKWQNAVEDDGTSGPPATAKRAMAVGAHNGAAAPTIWSKSGCGPTRDGRVQPELAAPGSITGALNRNMNAANPGSLTTSDTGTSYAAPIVAGAAAVLFQCRGTSLTHDDIKQLLKDMAGLPSVGVPSNSFGYGYLQMGPGCTQPTPPVDVWLRDAVDDTGAEPYPGDVAWLSPDINVLDAAGNPVPNPAYDPDNVWNNRIDVTIRNRGAQAAQNIEIFLYWADPATNIPYPDAWNAEGIFTGSPVFDQATNRIVLNNLAAGAAATVQFAWAPPAPGSNIRGDNHFCLIARAEHMSDPSNVGAGGWSAVKGRNNVALRNLLVQSLADSQTGAGFAVIGTNDVDAIEMWCENLDGEIELVLPTTALPWRELSFLKQLSDERPYFGSRCRYDPVEQIQRVLESRDAARILALTGAERAHVRGRHTRIVMKRGDRLRLSKVRIEPGATMPVRVRTRSDRLKEHLGRIHITQRSGGRRTGGLSVELRERVADVPKYDVQWSNGKIEVAKREK